MNIEDMKKQGNEKGDVNPVVLAVAGAVIGAGIAVAGAVLSDEKNRKKIGKAAISVKDDLKNFVAKTKRQIASEKKILNKKILANRSRVKKVVASAKNSVHKTTKEVNKAVKAL